jgi:hypothetical protein
MGRLRGALRGLLAAGRWWIERPALVILLALLVPYVGSYLYLTRRGMREARACNMKGFLYVPVEEVLTLEEATREEAVARHYRLARLYAPVNKLDQLLFGADGPSGGFFWGPSK